MSKNKRHKVYIYPKDIYAKLEFDKVIDVIRDLCSSILGKNLVDRIRPSAESKLVANWMKQLEEFSTLIATEVSFPVEDYLDLGPEIDRLKLANSVLSSEELFRIYKVLVSILSITLFFKDKEEELPSLYAVIAELDFKTDILNSIKKIMDENGQIRSNASAELIRIRRDTNAKFKELNRVFNSVMATCKKAGYLTPEQESTKGGKRVLSVLSEYKRKVTGLILDESGSGRITFIEPQETLQINNDLTELRMQEKREIYRILKNISEQIRPICPDLKSFNKIMGIFDFIRAKALFGKKIDGIVPLISEEKLIHLIDARHPVLYLINKAQQKEVVPMSLHLDSENTLLVISGPNAGGKSVSLKTVGLIQLMFQCGIPIPAEPGTELGFFTSFMVDIGDEQSLENDLSTYSSRLKNMKYFVQFADKRTLFLIDEFGSGTDPAFGGAIAEAILADLNKKVSFGVVTTHYTNLKVFASKQNGIINGSMAFDKKNLSPLYQLEIGKPGSSYAFELAEKSGLSKDILKGAKEILDKDVQEFDVLLSTLQSEKQELIKKDKTLIIKQKELEELKKAYKAQKDQILKNKQELKLEYQQKAQAMLDDINKKFENMVRKWNEDKNDKSVLRTFKDSVEQERKKLKEGINTVKSEIQSRETIGKIELGATVKLMSGSQQGTVIDVKNNKVTVSFGDLKTTVKKNELIVIEKKKTIKVDRDYKRQMDVIREKTSFDSSIDLRGKYPDEALRELDKFMDKALMVSADKVRIVHGKGTGTLRNVIRKSLRQYNSVDTYENELPEFGGDGITIVTLK